MSCLKNFAGMAERLTSGRRSAEPTTRCITARATNSCFGASGLHRNQRTARITSIYRETFSEKRDSASKEIGQLGDRLRKVRNKCDYADNINSVSDVVEVAMINAERLKTALENLK